MKSLIVAAAVADLVLSGCATPAVEGPHADIATRMDAIAARFEQALRTGGMAGVIMEIDNCYASATKPVIRLYALRDCVTLDYIGYRMDVDVGRRLFHQSLPYFTDTAFSTRADHYAQLDGFTSPAQLAQYPGDTNEAV